MLSSNGAVTYRVAKELASILSPLVGQSPHHIRNAKDFVEQDRNIRPEEGEMHHFLCF